MAKFEVGQTVFWYADERKEFGTVVDVFLSSGPGNPVFSSISKAAALLIAKEDGSKILKLQDEVSLLEDESQS